MPICKRADFDLNQLKDETFQENEKVFCCYITKRIFREYEQYFRHVMAINSTVWQCEATGRDNLTYEEAKKSERIARKKMENFKKALRAPTLMVIESARQSALKTLNLIVARFLRKRYFLNEEVTVVNKKKITYTVIAIIPSAKTAKPINDVYEDTDTLEYRLREIKGNTEITVKFDQLRRQRMEFTAENLQMFVKNNVVRVDGILRPKPESYAQYVTDRKMTFANIFIGKMPRYSPAKAKKPEQKDTKKQGTLNKYIVKGDEAPHITADKPKLSKLDKERAAAAAEARAKSLQEEMERIRIERQERIAELERQKAEKKAKLMERVETECNNLLTKTDDLDRNDHQVLPTYHRIETILPDKLLGDCFMLREFMHSYAGLLSGIEVFKQKLSFFEVTRAMTEREVAGPLSDILLVLLGTLFDLQTEEEEECPVQYRIGRGTTKMTEPYTSIANAARSHLYADRHFSFKINELPMDAFTLSEVLRMHLLSSGSAVTERADKWRVMYRNGYSSNEDPGLELRRQHSHILRTLKHYSIYQLGFRDIMRVIRCLMAQILTYSATINIIEERMDQMAKARIDLRMLIATENKRLGGIEQQRRKLTSTHYEDSIKEEVRNDPAKKQALDDRLNKSIAELLAQSDRERRKHDTQLKALRTQVFNFLVFLGMDRAYRKYYVLESIPGIFIEHAPDSMDTCLEHPPVNKSPEEVRKLLQLPKHRRDLRNHLLKLYGEESKRGAGGGGGKPNASKQSLENKENQEHRVNGLSNGNANGTTTSSSSSVDPIEVDDQQQEQQPQLIPTSHDLFMCSGVQHSCIVHNERHADRHRWSYIYKEEEIEALLNSLNPLGERESKLIQELSSLRELIEQHTKDCPVEMLSLETEKQRQLFRTHMHQETNRKYSKSNLGFSHTNIDLSEVMHLHLIDRLLQFESDIFTGNLGQLKVKDMAKWRDDLHKGEFDPQGKLQWGPGGNGARTSLNKEEDAGSENGSIHDGDLDNGVGGGNDEDKVGRYATKPYYDPGQFLDATQVIDSEDSDDDDVPMLESPELIGQVRNLASALLQVEQAIEQRFLKEPFGVSSRETNKERLEQKLRIGRARLRQWEISLMQSTSFSQVFLHLSILHDSTQWARSTNKSLCQVCRRGTDPEKMLLCDECNGGTHMFCMKPKMRSVPEGNWYCGRCVRNLGLKNEAAQKKPKNQKRKFIAEEEEVTTTTEDQLDHTDVQDGGGGGDGDSEVSSASAHVKLNGGAKRRSERRSSRRLKSKEIEQELVNDNGDDDEEENDDDDVDENDEENEEQEEEEEEGEEEAASGNEAEDDEDEDAEGTAENTTEAEEDNNCTVCWYDGCEVRCSKCSDGYHLECVNLRRVPRNEFVCKKCKPTENNRRPRNRPSNADDGDGDDDNDEPSAKRSRSSRSSLRISLQNGDANDKSRHSNANNNNNNTTNNNNNRRSGRRTNDNLPLNSPALYDLLEQIMKHKASWPFLRPVLPSEVPDYHKIIKTPMDLAKVKSKLNMGEYQLNEELLNDLQLVFRNCDLYNVQGNEIYDAGSKLERFVMERCKDFHLPFKPSDMNIDQDAMC